MNSQNQEGQSEFDFARGDQLALLDALQIESGDVGDGKTTVRVSGATAKSVLRAMEAHARRFKRCWASSQTIGNETGRSERTVRRAMKYLRDLQLILVDPREGRSSLCRINWGEISLRSSAKVTGQVTENNPGHSFANPGQFDTDPGQFDANPGQCVRRSVSKRKEKRPLPPSPLDDTSSWESVERHIVRSGVREWVRVSKFLRSVVTPSHASEILQVFAHRSGAYGNTALYLRLMRSHPDLGPEDGWPDPLVGSDWANAEAIRVGVRTKASRRTKAVSDAVLAAVTVGRLRDAGLGDCATPHELNLCSQVQRLEAAK